MAYEEKERYIMLVHPTDSMESWSQTNILSFFPGYINVQDALNSKLDTLNPNYLTIASDQVFKQRKFTLIKPTDDITFMLLRAFLKEDLLKIALIFGTTNLAYLLSFQSSDAKAVCVRENQSYKNSKADVIHFSFSSATILTEITAPNKG